jgi:hypothetical protein
MSVFKTNVHDADAKMFQMFQCFLNTPRNLIIQSKLGSFPASSRNVVCSTQVSAYVWNIALKGTWSLPPPVKLESRHKTMAVAMLLKINNNNKNCWTLYHLNIYVLKSILFKYNCSFSISIWTQLRNDWKCS